MLTFRYKVSSEKKMDLLRFYLDGERLESWSGEVDWATFILALEAGPHELRWEYDKDYSGSQMEDTGYLDDVCVAAPVAATGVEMQETASVAGYRTVQLTWNVLPDTAFNRDVTFTSSDEAIATVNEMGQVTGVSQGEATITVTTKDGGFTDTCLVTVTPDEPPVNLYGFIWAQFADDTEGYYREPNTWGSFTDTNPKDAKILGQMPAGDGVQEGTVVLCAELVGDTVYGYTQGATSSPWTLKPWNRGRLGMWNTSGSTSQGMRISTLRKWPMTTARGPCTSSICLGSCTRWIWKPATWIWTLPGCWMASYRVLPPVSATTPVALPLTWTETPTL